MIPNRRKGDRRRSNLNERETMAMGDRRGQPLRCLPRAHQSAPAMKRGNQRCSVVCPSAGIHRRPLLSSWASRKSGHPCLGRGRESRLGGPRAVILSISFRVLHSVSSSPNAVSTGASVMLFAYSLALRLAASAHARTAAPSHDHHRPSLLGWPGRLAMIVPRPGPRTGRQRRVASLLWQPQNLAGRRSLAAAVSSLIYARARDWGGGTVPLRATRAAEGTGRRRAAGGQCFGAS